MLPADGKEVAVTVASNIGAPLSLGVATLTNEGPKAFEGQSYPTLKVQSQIDKMIGRESRLSLHMLPDAPILPAGATGYTSDANALPLRYVYTYADLTLESLDARIKAGSASFFWGATGSPDTWTWINNVTTIDGQPFTFTDEAKSIYLNAGGGLAIPNLSPAKPPNDIFTVDAPVKLLMLERQAYGSQPLPEVFRTNVKELTLTNDGREDISIGDVKYAQACKVGVVVRRADIYLFANNPQKVVTRHASAWFGPDGLLKVELKGPGA